MLTIIPNPKAMDYDKLIDFLNKRKNIELNRFKQRGNKNVKDIAYRINKETNRPELIELLWNRGHYIHPLDQLEFKKEKYSENNTIPCTVQELVANDILEKMQVIQNTMTSSQSYRVTISTTQPTKQPSTMIRGTNI